MHQHTAIHGETTHHHIPPKIQSTCQCSCRQSTIIVWCINQFDLQQWCPTISRSRFLYNPEILHKQIKQAFLKLYWKSGHAKSKVRSMRGYEGSPTARSKGICLSLIQTLVLNLNNDNLALHHYAMNQDWVHVRANTSSITQLLMLQHNCLQIRRQCCEHAGIRWQSGCENEICKNDIVCVLAKIQSTCQSSCRQSIRIVWCIKQFDHHQWCPTMSRSRFLYKPEILHEHIQQNNYCNCTDKQGNQRSRLGTCGATRAVRRRERGGYDFH